MHWCQQFNYSFIVNLKILLNIEVTIEKIKIKNTQVQFLGDLG